MRFFFKSQLNKYSCKLAAFWLKIARALFIKIVNLPVYLFAIPFVLTIRFMRPLLLIRFGSLSSSRLGHFAANTELYLCERDAGINVPHQRYADIFYHAHKPVCNQQLATMWQRRLRIWRGAWFLRAVDRLNQLIPGGHSHRIGTNSQHDRDVHNLMERFHQHLEFTEEEELRGKNGLRDIGIPEGAPFVCITVRDSAYLEMQNPRVDYSYHNFRDASIGNYVLAAETLAEHGYFVIRMGVKVIEPFDCSNPKVIDYACNGMRSDFMDIYLGAKCTFCVTQGTGFDAIPIIFRRPILMVNAVPLGYAYTWSPILLILAKHHIDTTSGHELTMSEIFSRGSGYLLHSSEFTEKSITLVENSPEEIRDVVVEMIGRIRGTWTAQSGDEVKQQRFWKIFPTDAIDAESRKPIHGKIRVRFGADFLRNNLDWLD